MKITASRKDDILKRKAQYEADMEAYKQRQNASRLAYNKAEDAVLNPIREYLERKLSRYSALTFDIDVRRGYTFHRGGDNLDFAEVSIRCNEHNKFDDDVALSWSYRVNLDSDGSVLRESSSWSGLSATTEAQMRSLHQTVSALDMLNDIDWAELIKVTLPDYDDYYDPNDKEPEGANWDRELENAELEESIGTNKWFCVANWGESCPYRGYVVWVNIIKDSGSQYTVNVIGNWDMQMYIDGKCTGDDIVNKSYVKRVRKSSITIASKNDPYVVEVK